MKTLAVTDRRWRFKIETLAPSLLRPGVVMVVKEVFIAHLRDVLTYAAETEGHLMVCDDDHNLVCQRRDGVWLCRDGSPAKIIGGVEVSP